MAPAGPMLAFCGHSGLGPAHTEPKQAQCGISQASPTALGSLRALYILVSRPRAQPAISHADSEPKSAMKTEFIPSPTRSLSRCKPASSSVFEGILVEFEVMTLIPAHTPEAEVRKPSWSSTDLILDEEVLCDELDREVFACWSHPVSSHCWKNPAPRLLQGFPVISLARRSLSSTSGLSAPSWLNAPSAPPWTVIPQTLSSSLVSLAPPWIFALTPPQTSESAALP
ncbi:hypothetical protein DPX16_13991 [Anabarilius grahami]|uniref:Uncharacterized protein n=1 Tax=Anabarilius grahami TaxID=495550 RepID=A0A3N0Y8W4_ANAGA|nr:hypothetical protein DPX16_13991 [Anabarilius grahami]